MILTSLFSRARSTSLATTLRSAPLATMMIATLALWGCGGGGGGGGTGGEGGVGGAHTGGTSGGGGAKGGAAGGGLAGKSGSGGDGGAITTGTGGTAGAGTGGAGTGGTAGAAGTGGTAGAGTGGAAGAGTGGAAGAGTGGAAGAGTGGAAGAGTGGTAGAGGATQPCTTGSGCTATGNVKGVCVANACVACTNDAAGDSACAGAYGNGNICVANVCVTGDCHNTNSDCQNGKACLSNTCSACTTDTQCGANHLCVNSACVAGNCRTTPDCGASGGLVCVNMTCTGCTTDASCSPYGQYICVSNVCTPGNCHATAPDCASNNSVCNLSNHTCTACTTDTQCADPANYNTGHYCQNNACVSGQCRLSTDCTGGKVCNGSLACVTCGGDADCVAGYGNLHVCVGGACVAGTCTGTSQCASSGQLCQGNNCVGCNADTDCSNDAFYSTSAHICVAHKCVTGTCHDSSTCKSAQQVCSATTHTCGACGSDGACQNDSSYGASTICLNGATCVTGNCHDTSADCNNGQICGASTAHTCGACATDTACKQDAHYGAGDICYLNGCTPGNCHGTSTDCNSANGDAGLICSASSANSCGKCSTDTQCESDTVYGSATICETATGTKQGTCVTNTCSASGACLANGGDFCCGGTCVPGNCCVDTDCGSFGTACVGHTCSTCNAVSGNKFYVDPVNGNDSTATGSDMSGSTVAPGCAFKTVARAIQFIPASPAVGTQIIIIGRTSGTTDLVASDLQTAANAIILPANTTLTNTIGPVTITLKTQATKTNFSGFQLQNSGSGIAGNANFPLVLNGNSNAAGVGVVVNPSATGTNLFSLSNVTIQNTGGIGIRVNAGTLTIGAGVTVSGSAADGLLVAAGIANISNSAGTQTLFTGNNVGIEASGTGSVNIVGTPTTVPSNNGTVLASFNVNEGLRIDQTPGAAGLAVSSINGLVAWANGSPNVAPGVHLFGGSQVKIRNSVLLNNGTYGVQISTNGATTAAGSDVSGMDLGIATDAGHNYLQAPFGGAGVNAAGGLCVLFNPYTPVGGQPATLTETVKAYGNKLASSATPSTQVDCATTAAAVTQGTCGTLHSIGVTPATNITATVTFGMCL